MLAWAAALLVYGALVVWGVEARLPYYVAIAVLAVSLCTVHYRVRAQRTLRDNIFSFASGLLLALLLGVLVLQGQMGYGIDATLSWLYLVAGIRYWQRYERKTTGVLTAVFGFLAASFIFPLALMVRATYVPHLTIGSSIRNLPKFIIAVGILLTFLEEEMGRTEHLALHDALTGLPNRRLLEDRMANMLERAERNRTRAAILVLDLDGFKQINDTHGHAVGDEFLREVSLRLGKVVRRADTLARSGGDEFTVLVSDILQPNGAKILPRNFNWNSTGRLRFGNYSCAFQAASVLRCIRRMAKQPNRCVPGRTQTCIEQSGTQNPRPRRLQRNLLPPSFRLSNSAFDCSASTNEP